MARTSSNTHRLAPPTRKYGLHKTAHPGTQGYAHTYLQGPSTSRWCWSQAPSPGHTLPRRLHCYLKTSQIKTRTTDVTTTHSLLHTVDAERAISTNADNNGTGMSTCVGERMLVGNLTCSYHMWLGAVSMHFMPPLTWDRQM